MKTASLFKPLRIGLLMLAVGVTSLHAEITVRVSVKFILQPNGTRPDPGVIGTIAGFNAEVAHGNRVLAATGRGYRVQVVEYLDIQPPPPEGKPADYWFSLNARANRAVFETAALADRATWGWNADAINCFVNDSGSGQCSFVGNGLSISLGNNIGTGTVLHELGHFFDLRHTHSATDNDGTVDDWGDGDHLEETLDDDPDASFTDIIDRYPNETQKRREDLFHNVMSYHLEDRLLTGQMDIWALNANGARNGFCSGKTWFVAQDGSDSASGANASSPLATLRKALSRVSGPDDVILLRAGTYRAPSGGVIATPCFLGATRGEVDILR